MFKCKKVKAYKIAGNLYSENCEFIDAYSVDGALYESEAAAKSEWAEEQLLNIINSSWEREISPAEIFSVLVRNAKRISNLLKDIENGKHTT